MQLTMFRGHKDMDWVYKSCYPYINYKHQKVKFLAILKILYLRFSSKVSLPEVTVEDRIIVRLWFRDIYLHGREMWGMVVEGLIRFFFCLYTYWNKIWLIIKMWV